MNYLEITIGICNKQLALEILPILKWKELTIIECAFSLYS